LALDQAIPRFYYEWEKKDRTKNLGSIWFYHWVTSLLVGIIVLIFSFYFSNSLFPDVPFYPYIFLGLINRTSLILINIPNQVLRVLNKPLIYAIFTLLNLAVTLGCSIYYVLFLDRGIEGYFVAGAISGVTSAAFSIIIMLPYATPCIKSKATAESFKYALPLIPATIIGSVTNTIDRFLLQQYSTIEILGIYTIATKFAKLVFMFHTALKLSYVPFLFQTIAENTQEKSKEIITEINIFYLVPIFVAGIGISAFISDFVYFINRPSYFPIVEYVPFIVVPWVAITFFVYLMPGLSVSKRTDLMWIPNIFQLAVVSITSISLIPEFGIHGIIITLFISHITYMGVHYWLSERVYPIQNKWRKIFVLFGMMMAVSIWINGLEFSNLLISILVKLGIIGVYGLFSIVFVIGANRSWTLIQHHLK
jgi:O-antigen/teichoic acid export membrane protein